MARRRSPFFEITTAVAFLAFARSPADLLLMETGLGGRLDATNVIGRPALTALTPVSIDHVGFLGESLGEIAAEKAGILKPDVACVMAAQDRRTLNLPRPGLVGAHQAANAAQAVTILDNLDAPLIQGDAVAQGVKTVRWPARLQQLTAGKLAKRLPDGWELWLDGGHNAAAGMVLATQAAAWDDRPLYLITGILNSKDPSGFLGPLAAHAARLAAVAIPGEAASLDAEEVAALAAGLGLSASAMPSVAAAMAALTDAAHAPARILICGSLYLAGHVLEEN